MGCTLYVGFVGAHSVCVIGFTQSDWNVVKRGWEAHVLGEALNKFKDPVDAIKTLKAWPLNS